MKKKCFAILIMVLVLSSSSFALFQAPFEEGVKPVNFKPQKPVASGVEPSNVKSFFPKEVKQEEAAEGIMVNKVIKPQVKSNFNQFVINAVSLVFSIIIVIAGLIVFWPKRK